MAVSSVPAAAQRRSDCASSSREFTWRGRASRGGWLRNIVAMPPGAVETCIPSGWTGHRCMAAAASGRIF